MGLTLGSAMYEASKKSDNALLRGSCLCGAVAFTVANEFLYAGFCHCSRCRRRSGSAFSSFGGIELEKLQVVDGHEHLRIANERPGGHACFCGVCLSPLFLVLRGGRFAHVQYGVLEQCPSKMPDHHCQVAFKAPWFEISDGFPCFSGYADYSDVMPTKIRQSE